MKNLDLNAYGVEEMNQQEMIDTNGGIAWWAAVLIVVAVLVVVELFANDNNPDTKVEVKVDGETHRVGN
jgi:lactobin A/cerein 7B family class IIb bacteriocin